MLAGAVAISVWASIADHFPGDVAVGRWLQSHGPGGEPVIEFVRDFGSTPAGMAAAGVFVFAPTARRKSGLALVVGLMVLGFVLQGLLKEVVDRPRTSIEFLDARAGFGSKSFPSGHEQRAGIRHRALAGAAACLARGLGSRLLRIGLAAWALGIGLL